MHFLLLKLKKELSLWIINKKSPWEMVPTASCLCRGLISVWFIINGFVESFSKLNLLEKLWFDVSCEWQCTYWTVFWLRLRLMVILKTRLDLKKSKPYRKSILLMNHKASLISKYGISHDTKITFLWYACAVYRMIVSLNHLQRSFTKVAHISKWQRS